MKLIKYYTKTCTICRVIEKPVLRLVDELNSEGGEKVEYASSLIDSENPLGIVSVPTFYIEKGEENIFVCSGGSPNSIINKIKEKIKELK